MLNIYDYVFNVHEGQEQVQCPFHDDEKASAGVGPELQFNCFTCGVKAHDDIGFIKRYFNVGEKRALSIKAKFENADKYTPTKGPLTIDQRQYLQSIGLSAQVINKYFYCQSNGKLIYEHTWNGYPLGTTWFNNPCLPNWNASAEKYKYQGIVGGMCTPYDDVVRFNDILICEGEKDMLTAKSLGIKSAVAKLGGAKTPLLAGINFDNKRVIICYDCDETGIAGAKADAKALIENNACHVKVINLGLKNKEDLNDYFIKYKHTVQDFFDLVKATPEYVIPPEEKLSKVDRFLRNLTIEELNELKEKLGGQNEF